jgi:ABC-type bacteriocin/lantibiotic exporter with double-glycine peptidase domain
MVSKIILARSIVCNSRLLVVTDHLNKLMPNERQQIMDYLVDKSNPWTLIVVSNQSQIAAQCDRVVLMKDGRIINDDIFEAIEERSIFNA